MTRRLFTLGDVIWYGVVSALGAIFATLVVELMLWGLP